jgi:hypothetical protein
MYFAKDPNRFCQAINVGLFHWFLTMIVRDQICLTSTGRSVTELDAWELADGWFQTCPQEFVWLHCQDWDTIVVIIAAILAHDFVFPIGYWQSVQNEPQHKPCSWSAFLLVKHCSATIWVDCMLLFGYSRLLCPYLNKASLLSSYPHHV